MHIAPHDSDSNGTTQDLRVLIRRVLNECPNAPEAWEVWARTEAFAPDPQKAALDAIEAKARQAWGDEQAATMLIWVGLGRMRLGDDTAAREIAEFVARAPALPEEVRTLNQYILGKFLRRRSPSEERLGQSVERGAGKRASRSR